MYFRYLAREFAQPINYILAIGIGVLINTLQGNSPISSIVPYLVPIFVQTFSKSYVKFSNRHNELLLSLPSMRIDPAFLMDCDGAIVLSTGRTKTMFEERGLSSLSDLLDEGGKEAVLSCAESEQEECGPVEAYSPPLGKWYKIKTEKSAERKLVLVWFEDITERRDLDEKLSKVRDFSNSMIEDLDEMVNEDTSFSTLAELILEIGYEGVFIAGVENGDLSGHVYKNVDGEVQASHRIDIDAEAEAPIWLSRREERIFYDEIRPSGDRGGAGEENGHGSPGSISSVEEFARVYPFDRQVVEFLGTQIRSFVNYHEGDVSIIAFNLPRAVGSGDLLAMEVLVNSARSVSSLLRLASDNDQKFLQSVTGLCAAAEYSDEITGTHILRVNEYSRFLAAKIGMAEKGQKHIGQVAAMHDIGKVAIPHLIKLDRKFTPEERRNMQMHTIYGAQIIEKMMNCCNSTEPRLAMAYEIALNHHQQWDGNGYPPIYEEQNSRAALEGKSREEYDGLRPARGSEIPLTARIVSLADTYDALRSPRQYKAEKSHEETLEIIREDDRSGVRGEDRFGADLMKVFESHHEKLAEIYEEMKE